MFTSILIPVAILSFLAIIISALMISSYYIRQKRHTKELIEGNYDPRLRIYREKENTLRTWYGVLCGLDLILQLLGIFGNTCSIFLTVNSKAEQDVIVALMILSFVCYSLRDALNISNLRKTYMKAVRHLEIGLDRYEFDKEHITSTTYLTDLYAEAQMIIEDRFE